MIRSFSNLLVTRTCIILWMSSNFGQIGPPTTELAALERLRNTPIDLIMGKMVFPLFLCCFWSDPFDTFMFQEQALKLGWVWIFWNEIWPWHIGLRWVIVALWATCCSIPIQRSILIHNYSLQTYFLMSEHLGGCIKLF